MQNQTESTRSERAVRSNSPIEKMCASFDRPDEVRPFQGHGHLDVLNFGEDTLIGRGVFEPGWKWSTDVKPIAGTESCEAAHVGYCVEGKMRIAMDDGKEFTIHPGDAFQIPPGHDAWVEGDDTCVMIDVSGYRDYALERVKH